MNHTTNYSLNQWEAGDRITRADFNADNAKIDAAIAGKCEVVFGSYAGDDTFPRVIELGFRPKAAILMTRDGTARATYVYGGIFGDGYPLRTVSGICAQIGDTGFTLPSAAGGNNTNVSGTIYYYIALK